MPSDDSRYAHHARLIDEASQLQRVIEEVKIAPGPRILMTGCIGTPESLLVSDHGHSIATALWLCAMDGRAEDAQRLLDQVETYLDAAKKHFATGSVVIKC